MKRPSTGLLLSWLGLGLILLGVLVVVTFCRPEPEPPTPATVTIAPSVTLTATPEPTDTLAPPTSTPGPTAYPPGYTRKPTPRPPFPTRTPRPPTATPEPTGTPLPLRDRVRVEPGDTLWGIACRAYADIPLRPGANPLTPCTCWPGLWLANAHIKDARLILPRWWVNVPKACIQAPF